MNELVVADRGSEWRRLKALVLDSVSYHAPGVQPRARRIHRLVYGGAAAHRVHKTETTREISLLSQSHRRPKGVHRAAVRESLDVVLHHLQTILLFAAVIQRLRIGGRNSTSLENPVQPAEVGVVTESIRKTVSEKLLAQEWIHALRKAEICLIGRALQVVTQSCFVIRWHPTIMTRMKKPVRHPARVRTTPVRTSNLTMNRA